MKSPKTQFAVCNKTKQLYTIYPGVDMVVWRAKLHTSDDVIPRKPPGAKIDIAPIGASYTGYICRYRTGAV